MEDRACVHPLVDPMERCPMRAAVDDRPGAGVSPSSPGEVGVVKIKDTPGRCRLEDLLVMDADPDVGLVRRNLSDVEIPQDLAAAVGYWTGAEERDFHSSSKRPMRIAFT